MTQPQNPGYPPAFPPQYAAVVPPSNTPAGYTQALPQPAYAPPAAYPAAPAGYPPQPAYAPVGAAPAPYDLGAVNMSQDGKNLFPLMPQPGQPAIQRLLALVSFVFNPRPPVDRKGKPRKPRYECALTCVQSSVPTEVGQTYHLLLRAAMSAHDLEDFGIKADSQLTRQLVGAINRIDPQAAGDWARMSADLQTRNFQSSPAVVCMISNPGRRAEKSQETGLPTGQYWPQHSYLPAPTQQAVQ